MLTKIFIRDYYIPRVEKDLAPSTVVGYKSTINKYILPTFGEEDLDNISVQEIEEWLDTIEKPGAAQKAYKTFRQIIRRAADYNIYHGDDPTTKHITLPKTPPYHPKILSQEEVLQLLEGFKGHYLEPTVICAVMLGLRRGEAFGLTWEDIDLKTGKVYINKSYQRIEGRIHILPTKTIKSTRVCYLPSEVLPRMRQLGKDAIGRISCEPSPDKMVRDYKEWCDYKNLPYTSFTNLRHTWATQALEAGADISIVANMLGHTEIKTAYEHYLQPQEKIYQETQENFFSNLKRGFSLLDKIKNHFREKGV